MDDADLAWLPPVRCFTCLKVIGNRFERYNDLLLQGLDPSDALDRIGCLRYCCRRMMIGSNSRNVSGVNHASLQTSR